MHMINSARSAMDRRWFGNIHIIFFCVQVFRYPRLPTPNPADIEIGRGAGPPGPGAYSSRNMSLQTTEAEQHGLRLLPRTYHVCSRRATLASDALARSPLTRRNCS